MELAVGALVPTLEEQLEAQADAEERPPGDGRVAHRRLKAEAAREEAIDEIKLRSRQYAKRQLTWLRRDPSIHWFYWKKTRILPDCLAFSTEILHTYGVS